MDLPGSPEQWTDLADEAAAYKIEARAAALRDEAPIRTLLARVLGVHTDERAWRRGGEGERAVAKVLARLGLSWHILHSIQVSKSGTDIDHLVIGPGGVFSINTKNHLGKKVWVAGSTFMVNGHKQTYVAASRSEAKKASRLLTTACESPVAVIGVIAVLADSLIVKEQPHDVFVIGRRRLADWLRAQPRSLEEPESAAIYDVARRSTTWLPST
jgi:hypothetical protein